MKILVTGSSGVIGRHLIKEFEHHQFSPVHFHKNTKNPLHYGDVTDSHSIKEKLNGCIGIVHLAAISRVKLADENPDLCHKVNIEGTENVLNAAMQSPYKPWVIYVSSQEIYGRQENFPVPESAKANPLSIYAKTKAAAEELTVDYMKLGLNTSIVRLSSVYGCVDDHPDKVIPAFCRAAADGNDLHVNASNTIFDFTHISDVTRGLTTIVKKISNKVEIPTLHLVSGIGTSLGQAAKLAIESGHNKAKIIESPQDNNNINKFYGDPRLAKHHLNWQTEISIQNGINNLVKQFIERSTK